MTKFSSWYIHIYICIMIHPDFGADWLKLIWIWDWTSKKWRTPGIEPVKSRDTLWKLKITSIIFWSEKKGWTMGIHLHRGSTYSEEDRWNWAIIATKDSQNQGARVGVMDLGFGWCHASEHHRMVRKTADRVTTTTATTEEFFTKKSRSDLWKSWAGHVPTFFSREHSDGHLLLFSLPWRIHATFQPALTSTGVRTKGCSGTIADPPNTEVKDEAMNVTSTATASTRGC